MKHKKAILENLPVYYRQEDVQTALKEKFREKYPDFAEHSLYDSRTPAAVKETTRALRDQELQARKRKKTLITLIIAVFLVIGVIVVIAISYSHHQKYNAYLRMENRVMGASLLNATVTYTDVKGTHTESAHYVHDFVMGDYFYYGLGLSPSINNTGYQLGQTVKFDYKKKLITIDNIHYDTGQAIFNTHAFLTIIKGSSYNEGRGYILTPSELQRILENGSNGTFGNASVYKPIKPDACGGLTEKQQMEIIASCCDYDDYHEYPYPGSTATGQAAHDYFKKFNSFFQQQDVQAALKKKFGHKYPNLSTMNFDNGRDNSLPAEVVKAVLAMYEGDNKQSVH